MSLSTFTVSLWHLGPFGPRLRPYLSGEGAVVHDSPRYESMTSEELGVIATTHRLRVVRAAAIAEQALRDYKAWRRAHGIPPQGLRVPYPDFHSQT